MFHFNRSLEEGFAANDMGRCDGGLWGPQAVLYQVETLTEREECGEGGEVVGGMLSKS